MIKKIPKIVIDSNVILSAFRSLNGASNKLMSLIGTDKFLPCISIGLILEYEDVLSRKLHDLNMLEVKQFLDYICSVAEHTIIHFLWRPTLKDPSDDMLLELAVSAGASYIVSYNVTDFKGIHKFNIEVIKPRDFLEIIGELS